MSHVRMYCRLTTEFFFDLPGLEHIDILRHSCRHIALTTTVASSVQLHFELDSYLQFVLVYFAQ